MAVHVTLSAAAPAPPTAGPADALVRVSLFGVLRVVTADGVLEACDFPGSKPRQLLEALLGQRGHRVSKDRLAELLWGDDLPRDHAATLETYVSVLRRTLAPRAPARRSVVVTEPGGYRIGPAGLEVDLDVFDALVARASGAPPTTALALLESALELVRGEVLEDAPEAPWALRLRETYRARWTQVLVDAGRLALVTGDATGALAHAERAVALDPLSEPPYQVLMTAAYALGRQSEALAAFDRCRRLLADELGADPLDETVALHLAILRHEAIAELLPGDRTAGRRPSGVPGPATSSELAGREHELVQLGAAVDRARQGRFTLAVVSGSTGLGKTRLLEQLAADCGLGTATNRCSDLERDVPYLALTMALDGAPGVPSSSPSGIDALVERVEQLPPDDTAATRLGLMEAFARALAGTAPLLLWLDDVQWADRETLTTLHYLQRRCAAAPVLVVLTCDGSRAAAAAVRPLKVDLRLDLAPLSAECVSTLGHPDLHAATGGHPLYVAGWLEARRDHLEQPFPPALCERVLMQCWDAGPQAYRLLGLAAALDETCFAAEVLAALAGLPLDAVADDLDRLLELGVLSLVRHRHAVQHPCAAHRPGGDALARDLRRDARPRCPPAGEPPARLSGWGPGPHPRRSLRVLRTDRLRLVVLRVVLRVVRRVRIGDGGGGGPQRVVDASGRRPRTACIMSWSSCGRLWQWIM